MGGLGFLIKKYIYTCYYIKCIDHTYEGILAYSFIDKNTEFHMTIIGVYLPPEYSLFYQYQDESDILLLCGDINARIGNVNDVK